MILLDTHVLLWLVSGSAYLGEGARTEIQYGWERGEVAVSSFTFWEIAMLHAKGRLKMDLLPRALRRRLVIDGLRTAPVNDEIAIRAVELEYEGFHPDPVDRIVTATAIVGGYRLATSDSKITEWARLSPMISVLDPRQ